VHKSVNRFAKSRASSLAYLPSRKDHFRSHRRTELWRLGLHGEPCALPELFSENLVPLLRRQPEAKKLRPVLFADLTVKSDTEAGLCGACVSCLQRNLTYSFFLSKQCRKCSRLQDYCGSHWAEENDEEGLRNRMKTHMLGLREKTSAGEVLEPKLNIRSQDGYLLTENK